LTQNGSNNPPQFQSLRIEPARVELKQENTFSVLSTNITNPVQTQRETHSLPFNSVPTYRHYSDEPIVVQFLPQKPPNYSVVQNNQESTVGKQIRQ
jgi:hypothetical protein